MTLTMVSGTSTAYNASAYMVTGGEWTSATLQWSNKPAANTLLQSNISHNNKTKYQFSCLAAVQHWYDGDTTGQHENYGIMVQYADETIADYNSFYSADCTDANSRPALTISYTPVDDSHSVLEGETLALPTTRAAGTFTWTSSDTTVATVNSNGVVSGIRAGKVTITASLDGSEYKKYTVHVIIEDGVYQIRNNAGLYLGTNGGTSENTSVYLQSKVNSGVYQLYQTWKVTYLGKGYYSVRPLYKANMGMHASGTTGSAVDIVNVGMEDSLEDVLLINRWGIKRSVDGDAYYLNHLGTGNFGLKADGIIPSHGMGLTIEHNPGMDVFEWTFDKMTGVYLHDNNGNLTDIPDTFTKEVEMGGTYSTADMGIYLTTSNVDLAWSSDKSPEIDVDDQGTVTANNRGIANITASGAAGGTQYDIHVKVTSVETIRVKNYYDSTISEDPEKLAAIPTAVNFLNAVYKEAFYLKFEMDGDPVHYAKAVDECYYKGDYACDSSSCSSDLWEHHKNTNRISEELYPTNRNQIAVMWSDCAENVYCEFVSDENNPNVHLHKQVESTVIAQVIGKGAIYSDGTREYWFDPVIQIMTIDRNTQINKQELDDDQFLSLILAHEVAHTLGMGDVYNYKFYEDAPHCYASGSSSNTNDCIMESFGCLKAMTFYYDILYNGKSAFCANCTSRLQSEMASDLYAN